MSFLDDLFRYGGLAIFNPVFVSTTIGSFGVTASSIMTDPSASLSSSNGAIASNVMTNSSVSLSSLSGVLTTSTLLGVLTNSNANNVKDTDMIIESMSLDELNEFRSKLDEHEKKLKL